MGDIGLEAMSMSIGQNHWKRAIWLLAAVPILIGLSGAAACGRPASSDPPYTLTHSALDAEHLLGWDTVIDQCPLIDEYPLLEGFANTGEKVEFAPGEWIDVSEESGALWGSSRIARVGDPNTGDFNTFSVAVSFVESDAVIRQMLFGLASAGMDVEEGLITSVFSESPIPGLPKPATQINAVITANRIWVHINMVTGGDEPPFCLPEDVKDMTQHVTERLRFVSIGDQSR